MCNGVVIIKRFRELSLACLCTAVLLEAQPALATGSGKILAELWRNTYPVGSGTGNALAETSCENLRARSQGVRRGYAGESRRNGTPPNLVEVRRGVTVVGDLVW